MLNIKGKIERNNVKKLNSINKGKESSFKQGKSTESYKTSPPLSLENLRKGILETETKTKIKKIKTLWKVKKHNIFIDCIGMNRTTLVAVQRKRIM